MAGDGKSDDHEAIQAALDDAAAGGLLRLPSGDFLIGDTLLVPSGATLRGDGKHATVIRPVPDGGPPVLMGHRKVAGANPPASDVTLEDFGLSGGSGTRRGLLVEGLSRSNFSRLKIADVGQTSAVGLEIMSWFDKGEYRNPSDNNFYSLEVVNCHTAVRLRKADDDPATFGPGFQNFYGLRAYGYTEIGFDLDAGEGVTAIAMRCTSNVDGARHIRLNDDVPTLIAPCTDSSGGSGQTGIEITPECSSALILNPIGDLGRLPSNTRLDDRGARTIVLREPFTRLGEPQ